MTSHWSMKVGDRFLTRSQEVVTIKEHQGQGCWLASNGFTYTDLEGRDGWTVMGLGNDHPQDLIEKVNT